MSGPFRIQRNACIRNALRREKVAFGPGGLATRECVRMMYVFSSCINRVRRVLWAHGWLLCHTHASLFVVGWCVW